MNNFGLSNNVMQQLTALFQQNNAIKKVVIFGSRAIGSYRHNSDIDLVIFGDLDSYQLGNLNLDLEELNTPFLFDVLNANAISSAELKTHIQHYGKILYEKNHE